MESNLYAVDWAIFAAVAAALVFITYITRRYTKSVLDFLAAGRTARRYLLTVTSGAAGHAAVRVVATFEIVYKAGFTSGWWPLLMPVNSFINLTGFVVYRFRETRALTLAQFLEVRYSKRLRIFSGMLMFVSGVLNMGIFPAVGARFFIYFCGLPESIHIGEMSMQVLWFHFHFPGATIPMLWIVVAAIVAIALYPTLGGQVTLLFTEFFEGISTGFAFLVILGFLFWMFPWHTITQTLMEVPPGQSMLNPFHNSSNSDFGLRYFIIQAIIIVYSTMAWQGNLGFNSAPATAHEGRMGKILGHWRELSFGLMILLMPIASYVMMHNSSFSASADVVNHELSKISSKQVQGQMTVPVALSQILPMGLKGILCAIMFCGFVGNLDTYLHSWGSIFIQDVILPFRKTPFEPITHIRLLRWSIVGVAVFISIFSVLYQPTEYIVMFQTATGAVYLAGAGAMIIGGLYWKFGTTAGAWTGMIFGAIVMIVSITIRQIETHYNVHILKQPDPQIVSAIAMGAACTSYVLVSLLTCRQPFDLNAMLHRTGAAKPVKKAGRKPLLAYFGIDSEFTRSDRAIGIAGVVWAVFFFSLVLGTTIYCSRYEISDQSWSKYWQYNAWLAAGIGLVTTFWIAWGGIGDLKYMIYKLRTMKRDDRDDGMVINHHNLDEIENPPAVELKPTGANDPERPAVDSTTH